MAMPNKKASATASKHQAMSQATSSKRMSNAAARDLNAPSDGQETRGPASEEMHMWALTSGTAVGSKAKGYQQSSTLSEDLEVAQVNRAAVDEEEAEGAGRYTSSADEDEGRGADAVGPHG